MHLAQYPAAVARLIAEPRLNELGPGRPNRTVEADLRRLSPASLCGERPPVDLQMANACLAGLWLYHDFLDESHRLSQDGEDVSFRFWHGIMHRREPDYDNAKYWFRRVGYHPVFDRLLDEARTLSQSDSSAQSDNSVRRLLAEKKWDALAFVDLCEAAANSRPAIENLCRTIQLCEWRLLFDYCYRKATGEPRAEA
jgi:hypothetical protein